MRTIEAVADPVAAGVKTKAMMKALVYDTFGNAAAERALKVILTNPARP